MSTALAIMEPESWDDHVKAWHRLGRQANDALWNRAAVAASVGVRFGKESIKRFAEEVSFSFQTVYDFKRTFAAFPEVSVRTENLSFTHHLYAVRYTDGIGEAKAAVELAEHRNWSANELRTHLKSRKVLAAAAAQAVAEPERATMVMQDAHEFLGSLRPQSVDLLLTDPPYATDVDIVSFSKWLLYAISVLKPTGRAYVCVGAYSLELLSYLEAIREAEWLDRSQVLVWTYRNTLGPSPTHNYSLNWQAVLYLCGKDAPPLDCPLMVEQFAVQDINAPDGRLGNRYHAWQKPDKLAERFIRHASKPGDLVVDPFAGTGTFLLAAARLGRRAIGCDVSADSLKIAESRGCLVDGARNAS